MGSPLFIADQKIRRKTRCQIEGKSKSGGGFFWLSVK